MDTDDGSLSAPLRWRKESRSMPRCARPMPKSRDRRRPCHVPARDRLPKFARRGHCDFCASSLRPTTMNGSGNIFLGITREEAARALARAARASHGVSTYKSARALCSLSCTRTPIFVKEFEHNAAAQRRAYLLTLEMSRALLVERRWQR